MLTELGLYKLWREDPESAWSFARWFLPSLVHAMAPGHGYGQDRVPPTGAVVIACNHFSGIDPLFVGTYTRRTVYFMAKTELLAMPLAGEVLRWMGAFGVRRGEGDRDALRVARWLVGEGHAVGMFMEGTRQKLGYPGPAHTGAAMIAIQEQVPLVPAGLDTFRWSLRNRRSCSIVWGDPIDLSGYPRSGRGYKEATGVVGEEIMRLWRLAAQAVADGFPAQLSDGARRHGPQGGGRALPVKGARPWPEEPWAAGPLGPVHRGR
jgi:1-acyl-sn-glycerol-3-phosphate acyltransferase